MPEAPVGIIDQAVRDRVTSDLETTFLLAAGAGTGKTRVLVDRYVHCVLDQHGGTGDVRTVAAVTFTEKAAGELRQRVREELEARALAATPGSEEAAVVERAIAALDDAPIGTIHSFAGRLLHEYPVEAGIDPAFEQLDALGSDIERARLWEEWLGRLAASEAAEVRPARSWLARLLRAGVRLDHLRQLASGPRGVFGERYDADPVLDPPPEPDLAAGLEAMAMPLARLRDFCAAACRDQADKGFAVAMDLVEAVERLLADPPADVDRLAGELFGLPVMESEAAPGGRQGSWDAACGGKDELQASYRSLGAAVASLRDDYAGYVAGLAIAVADAFARWAGEAQIGLGRLDFADLLGRLRDLLVNDRAARAALQGRLKYLLVDEFQDTDPLQAEIVFLLCEREPLAADWREVVLKPGKLFVVGDPKQSIYRFRRADIFLYDEVEGLIRAQPRGSSAVEAIGQNFRTTPAVVEWVNAVFDDVFESDKAQGRQPGYQPVHAYRPPAAGSRVAVLLGREYGGGGAGESEAARRDEARAVAALLLEMRGPGEAVGPLGAKASAGAEPLREMRGPGESSWHVQDRGVRGAKTSAAAHMAVGAALGAAVAEPTRPPRWGDIALLFRATTGLETYEQALREAGVPYRVDGGTTYFQRREVDDALLCLRAVDDPSDGPALYGALHSTFFGFSDDDLFLFWSAGGRFDLFAAPQPAGHEGVARALRTLRELHELRREREPHELAAELIRQTHAAELAATTGSGAPQAMANLEKLVERARAFSGAGGGGLGAFLAWAAEARDAAGEQESQVDDEGDVVHLLTIHKAKGLEFPIVVLVGGALRSGGGREAVRPLVDRGARRLAVKLKAELPGAAARDLEPALYKELKEREDAMEASELRRLLYVAATRARDHLVVSCFGRLTTQKGDAAAGVMLAPIRANLPAPGAEPPTADYELGDLLDRGGQREHGGGPESGALPEHGALLVLAPQRPPMAAERCAAPDIDALLAERSRWMAGRAALLAEGIRPARATSPSGLEHVDEEVRGGGPGAPPGRATALALGSAVHRIMELCDLSDEASIERLATAVTAEAGRPDLAKQAAALAGACWRSSPVRAAACASALYRELPVGVLVDDIVVTGAVDLLYRDGDEWVIVDYKTDRGSDGRAVDPQLLRERYTPQGAAYAVAVERATGRPVREVVLVAAAADGRAVHIAVDGGLRAAAVREIGVAVDEDRAVRPDGLA